MLVWRRFVFPSLMVVVIALDQFSKEWIRANLPLGSGLEEVFRIRIIHIQNSGSAFGLFTDQSILLTIVAVIGLIVILIFHRYWGGASLLGSFAMSLVSAGAVGNLIDRIRL